MSPALGDCRPGGMDWRKDGECQLYPIEIQERGILEHLVNSAPPVRSSKLANKNVSVIARASKKK